MKARLIPCHLIAGSLGVGKTTAVLDYLKCHAGQEFVAVLTNDFGKIGMDASMLRGEMGERADAVHIINVPGGCICCTSYAGLESGLEELSKKTGVSRIIIEPSGLTLLESFAPTMSQICQKNGFEWMPVIALIDPARTRKVQIENLPYFGQLVRHAEILVANRCDRCKPEFMEEFQQWSGALQPPKLRVLSTSFGKLPQELFEIRRTVDVPAVSDKKMPHAISAKSGGCRWSADLVFQESSIRRALETGGIQRFKGLFHTEDGWRWIEWASGEIFVRPALASTESRAEWILDLLADEAKLEKCLTHAPD